ncbi:hypothetical protein PQX77_010332 [Marasmius sp. AFHP31]|nr:hypothetical protein PQX77_010332 [Marasmius sp. AFHP31]
MALVDEDLHPEERDPTRALLFREVPAQERLELRMSSERSVSIAPHLELDDLVQEAADWKTLTPFLVSQHGVLAIEWRPVSSPIPHVFS